MAPSPNEKALAWACCMVYSFVCFGIAVAFSVVLGMGISDDYGGEREPSYDEAARMAGYFDSNGVYQGGQPKWRDWSEDSYSCEQASQNEKYCQTWTTDRYYSDPEQEFLNGTCTCISPLDDSVELTFDAWYNLYDDSQTTSSSAAALQDAKFCSAWNCQEIRYTQECTCIEYETTTTCTHRQLRSTGGGSSNSCSTKEVCVALSCEYIESNFYTACNCDSKGERRAEWGGDWWREYTHCEDFSCLHSSYMRTLNEGFELASSATESASLRPDNVSSIPVNATVVVTGELDGVWGMDYSCTQTLGDANVWCTEWRGITRANDEEVVEQLCGCAEYQEQNSTEFCEVCDLEGVGIVIAGVILMFLAPLYSCVARGLSAPPISATPFGLAAACLVAIFFGGWAMALGVVIPALSVAVCFGWCVGKIRPTRVDPRPAVEAKDYQDAVTPLQTPMPVPGLRAGLPQTYQQPGLTPGPAQQPGISYGVATAAYTYTPPGGQQQPIQYIQYSAPPGPGAYNPPTAYGSGGNRGAYGGALQAGVPGSAPSPSQYGYQSPPQFKTGVDGGPGGYWQGK